jgi:hypothetical protein
MSDRGDKDDIGAGFSRDISVCVQTLDRVIGELANQYGAGPVAAALVEVVGCSSCVVDDVSRGTSIRALMGRIGVTR